MEGGLNRGISTGEGRGLRLPLSRGGRRPHLKGHSVLSVAAKSGSEIETGSRRIENAKNEERRRPVLSWRKREGTNERNNEAAARKEGQPKKAWELRSEGVHQREERRLPTTSASGLRTLPEVFDHKVQDQLSRSLKHATDLRKKASTRDSF